MRQCPSPNFGDRKGTEAPSYIILHYTAMDTAQAAIERLCAPEHEVSAHYVVDAFGQVTQLVDDRQRAWHAGRSYWRGETDLNSHSIGIELANTGFQPFSMLQIDSLIKLLHAVMSRWRIPPQNVLGHSDISLGRKTDPGARFPWTQLTRAGCAIHSVAEPASSTLPVSWDEFLTQAKRFGYDVSQPEDVLAALRMRFHPWIAGPLSAKDCAVMADLGDRFGIDLSLGTA